MSGSNSTNGASSSPRRAVGKNARNVINQPDESITVRDNKDVVIPPLPEVTKINKQDIISVIPPSQPIVAPDAHIYPTSPHKIRKYSKLTKYSLDSLIESKGYKITTKYKVHNSDKELLISSANVKVVNSNVQQQLPPNIQIVKAYNINGQYVFILIDDLMGSIKNDVLVVDVLQIKHNTEKDTVKQSSGVIGNIDNRTHIEDEKHPNQMFHLEDDRSNFYYCNHSYDCRGFVLEGEKSLIVHIKNNKVEDDKLYDTYYYSTYCDNSDPALSESSLCVNTEKCKLSGREERLFISYPLIKLQDIKENNDSVTRGVEISTIMMRNNILAKTIDESDKLFQSIEKLYKTSLKMKLMRDENLNKLTHEINNLREYSRGYSTIEDEHNRPILSYNIARRNDCVDGLIRSLRCTSKMTDTVISVLSDVELSMTGCSLELYQVKDVIPLPKDIL